MPRDEFCKMEYVKDENGNESLLKEGKFQVMMQWEKPYMQACIDAMQPFGDVLEVGFGLGFSADQIQNYPIKSHTIIEYHPEVLKRAKEWAKTKKNVRIVEGTWQDQIDQLGVFDAIFFDDYPLQSEEEMTRMQQQQAHSERILQQGQKVCKHVQEQLPFLETMRYSDADLAEFMQLIAGDPSVEGKQLVRFLSELASREQISEEQKQQQVHKLVAQGKISQEEAQAILRIKIQTDPFAFSAPATDRFYTFLQKCLRSHMRKGSRFSCFLSSAASKFEDDVFLKEIILNPLLDFTEEELDLEVPNDCTYFNGAKALVITITKQG